jgi:meckelin
LQWLWKVVVVHRFAGHPLHGFIDLLFLANTSAIILDERHSGYYLHGRNQMHHSGTCVCHLSVVSQWNKHATGSGCSRLSFLHQIN